MLNEKTKKFKTIYMRLIHIDKEIGRGNYPNCTTLAEKMEWSTRTIQRDIEYFKDRLKAPIEYDAEKRGYYYTEKNYRLSAIDINESDLFAIFIAEKALKQYENTPIYDKLIDVFEKIERSLPDKVSITPAWIDSKISFFGTVQRKIDPNIWEIAAHGLRYSKTIKIYYQTPQYNKATARDVDPYHLVSYHGEWYVVGFCHIRKEILTFAVSRIKKAEITERPFNIPEDFDFKKLTGDHFGIIWGKKDYEVKIWFSPEQTPYIKEIQWHPTQKIKERKDGSIILSLKTNDLYEIKQWILSWGKNAKVIKPEELKKDVKEELEEAMKRYK